MPCMVLANISCVSELVNGSRETARGIIVDLEGKFNVLCGQRQHWSSRANNSQRFTVEFFPIDDLHVLCTKPPRCVLFCGNRPQASGFHNLEDGIVPVFPIQRSVTIKNHSITRRKQVPMCVAFSLTDYKAQFSEGVVD